jgi:hypothetical protein
MKSYRISCQDILNINTYPNEISCEYILQDILLGILGYPENHYISWWDILTGTAGPGELALPFRSSGTDFGMSGFMKHSDWLMAQLLLSTSRARRWLSPGPWLPVARASCWVAAAAWSRRRRRSGPAMATGPPGPSCLSAVRQSVWDLLRACQWVTMLFVKCMYVCVLHVLSYILIPIILHTYLNYPTYVSQLSYISCHLSHLSATCLCSG